jgi:hypothetical protein
MAEQMVWAAKRVALAIPVPSVAAFRARVWLVGLPLPLAMLGAVVAVQATTQTFRSKSDVAFASVPAVRLAQDVPPTALRAGKPNSLEAMARSPVLAERVIRTAGFPDSGITTPAQFLRHSDARLQPQVGDILRLRVSSRHRDAAVALTNTYATEFTRLQAQNSRRQLEPLLKWYQDRIDALAARGQTGPVYVYDDLVATKHDLERQVHSAFVVEKADGAASVRPHAFRNALLGGGVGLVIGLALVLGLAARRRQGN